MYTVECRYLKKISGIKEFYIFICNFINILAWEPSVAQGTHGYSRHLPARGR